MCHSCLRWWEVRQETPLTEVSQGGIGSTGGFTESQLLMFDLLSSSQKLKLAEENEFSAANSCAWTQQSDEIASHYFHLEKEFSGKTWV